MTVRSMALALFLLAASGVNAAVFEDRRAYPAAGFARETLNIVSSTDLALIDPIVRAFQVTHPGISIVYAQASSREVFAAVVEGESGGAPVFDLAISSAMDLQTKLANDGYAAAFESVATDRLPRWAKWRRHLFAFTREPAVIVYDPAAFADGPPRSRFDLLAALRRNAEAFRGRIVTYDPETSGLGYLFATQDARQSETFWRLAEVLGSLETRLSCCTSDMLSLVETGEAAFAYNVLSSYAERRKREGGRFEIVAPQDYTLVMMRTALIPKSAKAKATAGLFIDFLLSERGRHLLREESGLPPLDPRRRAESGVFRPITLGPGLLVYLDSLKRKRFLEEWRSAVVDR